MLLAPQRNGNNRSQDLGRVRTANIVAPRYYIVQRLQSALASTNQSILLCLVGIIDVAVNEGSPARFRHGQNHRNTHG